jgi:two-component sensor histidine kinase
LKVTVSVSVKRLVAELRHIIHEEIQTMSTTLEAQLQASQQTTMEALQRLATDLTALAARLVPGNTISQADADAATAIATAATAAADQADAMVNPPAPPAP